MSRRVTPTVFRGQRVLLVGLGVHGGGVATAIWLVEQGAQLRITDTQTKDRLAPSLVKLSKYSIVYHLGGYQVQDWRWAQRIIVNPGVDLKTPLHKRLLAGAKSRGVPIENEASLFLSEFPGTAVAITGTRGKTTTTLLLGAILKRAHPKTIISGNVRDVAMLTYLPKTNAATWAVLELSSYQLERLPVSNRPLHVAIMTNLKVDHLNRHGTMAEYAAIKHRLFVGQTANDWRVLNWDDPWCRKAQRVGRGQTMWFSRHLPKHQDGITIDGQTVVEQLAGRRQSILPVSAWSLSGVHNLNNLLAAVAGARAMGIVAETIHRAVKKFTGVPYRQQYIRTWHGHRFVNDTTATSPDGTLSALELFPLGLFILGGTDKALDFRPLVQSLITHDTATVFLPGTATKKIQSQLRQKKYRRPLITVPTMSAAVQVSLRLAGPGQPIILSPGAASFGLFIHEFDRGDHFTREVKRLP